MYLAARSWGISPDGFWLMTFVEWLLEADFHFSEIEKQAQPGVLTDREAQRLKEFALG